MIYEKIHKRGGGKMNFQEVKIIEKSIIKKIQNFFEFMEIYRLKM